MGEANETLNLATQPPAVILMAGLQGAGKTTSVAKLAKFLQQRHKKKVWWFLPTFIAQRRLNSWKHWHRVLMQRFIRLMLRKSR